MLAAVLVGLALIELNHFSHDLVDRPARLFLAWHDHIAAQRLVAREELVGSLGHFVRRLIATAIPVLVDLSRQQVKFVESQQAAERIIYQEKFNRDDIALAFSSRPRGYNRGKNVSVVEKQFGDTLQTQLSVTPVYFSRQEIKSMLDKEILKTSAMMHAKELAARDQLDAVLVIYLRPVIVEADALLRKDYQLHYESQVSMRSVAEDKLIYHQLNEHGCSISFSSNSVSQKAEALGSYRKCEREIANELVAAFLEFANKK